MINCVQKNAKTMINTTSHNLPWRVGDPNYVLGNPIFLPG